MLMYNWKYYAFFLYYQIRYWKYFKYGMCRYKCGGIYGCKCLKAEDSIGLKDLWNKQEGK